MRKSFIINIAIILCASFLSALSEANNARIIENYGKIPLSFTINNGQDYDDIWCKNQDRNEAISDINYGYVTEYYVVSTIGHIRFLIVRVCQASDDIWFPYIALLGVLYS